jgi:DNA-binding XRE family transcriptional regulator
MTIGTLLETRPPTLLDRRLAVGLPQPVLARNLRELRLRAGLTQRELGARIGAAQQTVQQWETGRSKILAKWRPKLLAALI